MAEASCASTVRAARAVCEEVPTASGSSIGALARCREFNAEEDVHRLAEVFGLKLPLQVRWLPAAREEEIPYIALSSWAKYFMHKNLWFMLSGLDSPNEARSRAQWSLFWRRFRSLYPQHAVFRKTEDELSRTCAVLVHGDEGRGLKKSQIMILSGHSVLGAGSNVGPAAKDEYAKQDLNWTGHTQSTRWIFGALPRKQYDDDRAGNFQTLLDRLADDMLELFEKGIPARDGTIHYFAILHIVGDWPWMAKAFNFTRTFSNVAKHASSKNPGKGICHACLAGQDETPFEELETWQPRWKRTLNQEQPYDQPPPLMKLPHDTSSAMSFPGQDLFHGFHLGAGKTFMASVLALFSAEFEGRSVEARFATMGADFFDWCRHNKERPYIRKLTKDTINWLSASDYPSGGWSKGSTTVCLLRWFLAACRQRSGSIPEDSLLRLCFRAALHIQLFFSKIYRQQVWIESKIALELAEHGRQFLKYFAQSAKRSYDEGRALFLFMPNLHRLDHIFHDLRDQALRSPYAFSPQALNCQIDEDYIGRPSRISRRVSCRTTMIRVLQRSLEASYDHFVERGWLILDS